MITIERIYRDGFLDGMRYSGHLLADVPDEDLTITHTCETAILQELRKRSYFMEEEDAAVKRHKFIRKMVTDYQELHDAHERLKEYVITVDNAKSHL